MIPSLLFSTKEAYILYNLLVVVSPSRYDAQYSGVIEMLRATVLFNLFAKRPLSYTMTLKKLLTVSNTIEIDRVLIFFTENFSL